MGTQKFARLSGMVLVTSLTLFACKPRNFGETKSITVMNPDDPGFSACNETLRKDAPYTTKEFGEKLTSALNSGAKTKIFSGENIRDFLFADNVAAAMSGTLTAESLHFNDCDMTRFINESLTKPSYFFVLTGNGSNTFGGMTLYKGDVFAEGFYRNRSSGVQEQLYPRRAYSATEIMTQQPWLEWNSSSRSFTPKVGSPAVRIAQHIQKEQGADFATFHRGTNVKYSDKAKALASLNNYPFGNFGGIFTTPSFEAAKGWASPVVLSAKIDPSEFFKKITVASPERGNLPGVYIGIEYGYPEIAFLYAPGDKNNMFFDSITMKCVTDKAQGADVGFAEKCK
jgi:hypothetical protein